MIQIIPEDNRRSSGEQWGKAIGNALNTGLQLYQQHQQKKKFSQALQNIEGAYSNPELNEQQRLIQAYQELAGAGHPELAQQLGGQLARLGGQQENFKNKILGKQQDQQQLAQSFQNLQELYNDPNLSEEQKIFGVYNELNKNPALAHNILADIKKPDKERGENIAGSQYSAGYNAIVEGDDEALHEILSDSDTSIKVKKQLTDLKNKYEIRKDVQARELRSRQAIVQKSYRQAIEAEKKKITKDVYPRQPKSEVDRINKKIKRLEALEKHDLKRLTKNPDNYVNLSLWNAVDPDFLPGDEGEQDAQVIFDTLSDEQIEELFEESGGDIEVAKQLALERYAQ